MANQTDVSTECERCQGTGIHTDRGVNGQPDVNENPCIVCNGKGFIKSGIIDTTGIMNELDWLKKKIKKILQKLEILED